MKYSRGIAILAGVVFSVFCLGELSAGRLRPVPEMRVQRAEDAEANSMILVEAFMVEVPLSELYNAGVPTVSEGAKSVSAEQVLACLRKPRTGAVTAGAKLAVHKGIKARTETNTVQGVWSGPPEERRLEFQDFGVSLTAQGGVIAGGQIGLNLEFKHKGLDEGEGGNGAQPIITDRNWECGMTLEPGKPTLVGATQDEDTAVFLIVTANLMK